jgi:hypothetical protein
VFAALAVLAVVGVAAFFFFGRGLGTSADAASDPAGRTTQAAPTIGVVETDASAPSANPMSGQSVATDQPAAAEGGDVLVEVTFAGWNPADREAEIGGFVSGVVEDGGTCTLTLSKGGETVSAEAEGMADASTTSCGEVAVGADRLSAGTWEAVLSYASATSAGSAEPVRIEVSP